MKINNEEIKFKITPRAIEIVERETNFDILSLLRAAGKIEPKANEYYKLMYVGYIGEILSKDSKAKYPTYDEFLELLKDISLSTLSKEGSAIVIELLKIKN